MTASKLLKDLVVLTADKNARFAVQGILLRYRSLGIRQISADYYLHPGKDPGVLHAAHDFLRSFSNPKAALIRPVPSDCRKSIPDEVY